MYKIAILVADGFQDSEYFLPKIELEKLGLQTEVISISKEPIEIYSFFRCIGHLDIDKTIDEAKANDYVGVLVPGGAKSPAILAEDKRVLAFLREADGKDKMVASICRGTLLVAISDVAKGHEITGFHLGNLYPDLVVKPVVEAHGGRWREDRPVVVDRNLISSRHPDDIAYFSKAMEAWLSSHDFLQKVGKSERSESA
jgi:protease I